MGDYEYSLMIPSAPDALFAFVADVRNLPSIVQVIRGADSPSHGRVRVWGEAGGHAFDGEGYVLADHDLRLMEWGIDGEMTYRGWLRVVGPDSATRSRLTVNISFMPRTGWRAAEPGQDEPRDTARDTRIHAALAEAVHGIEAAIRERAGAMGERMLLRSEERLGV